MFFVVRGALDVPVIASTQACVKRCQGETFLQVRRTNGTCNAPDPDPALAADQWLSEANRSHYSA